MSGKDRLDHQAVVGAVLGGAGSGGTSDETLVDAYRRVSGFAPALLDEYHEALVAAFDAGHESTGLAETAVLLGMADLEAAATACGPRGSTSTRGASSAPSRSATSWPRAGSSRRS